MADSRTLSIITVTRNASSTIASCLESVRSQTLPVEHIIIDGDSSDGTLDIVEKHRDHIAKVVSEPDGGIFDAMNKGIRLAAGEIVGILNADDVYLDSHVLEKVMRVFRDPLVDSCYGDLVYVRQAKEPRDPSLVAGVTRYWKSGAYNRQRFYWGWMPPHPTFFVRRKVYEKHGLFNLEIGSAADYEIMLRFLVRHEISTVYIPEILVQMRTGGNSNASLGTRLKANGMDRKAWKVNGLRPYPWTLWLKPIRKMPQWVKRP